MTTKKSGTSKLLLEPTRLATADICHVRANQIENSEDVGGIFDGLNEAVLRVKNNDFSDLEAMLTTQIFVLQNLFSQTTRKMSNADRPELIELYSNLAFKSQNQCRNTILALAEIKNPKRATFIKQQNNLQVNEGLAKFVKPSGIYVGIDLKKTKVRS